MSAYYFAFLKSFPSSFDELNSEMQSIGVPLKINSTEKFDEHISGINFEFESIPLWVETSVQPISELSGNLKKLAPPESNFAVRFRYGSSWIEFFCILGISAALIKTVNAKIYNDFNPTAGFVSHDEIINILENSFNTEKECFNQIIEVGQKILQPHGLYQTQKNDWIDDHGRWISFITVPMNLGTEAELEVGSSWLWHKRDFLSYDVGPFRFRSFEKYKSPEHFRLESTKQFEKALEKISSLRNEFKDTYSIAQHLKQKKGNDLWKNFDAGIALGLSGETDLAKQYLTKVTLFDPTNDVEWVRQAMSDSKHLQDLLSDKIAFEREIKDRIQFRRKALNLKQIEIQFKP